jgi:hyperosmotically inducible protein
MAKLTAKGRVVVGLIVMATLVGGGLTFYSHTSGLSLGQMWGRLMSSSASRPSQITPAIPDVEIEAHLLKAVLRNAQLRGLAVDVAVSNGVVTFSGEVSTAEQKAAVETLAQPISGVKQIVNNLVVKAPSTPVSTLPAAGPSPDEQLSEVVEFTLYKTDAFDLKQMKIACKDSVVQLSGSARNLAEKLLAERLAREVDGVKGVVNELTLAGPNK